MDIAVPENRSRNSPSKNTDASGYSAGGFTHRLIMEVINETCQVSPRNIIQNNIRMYHLINGDSSGGDNVWGDGYHTSSNRCPNRDRASASD